ncbi:MAG: hypothetical protein LBK91_04215 [Synergistaceae bacterium]|jgi:hypothetical protein|nr:hypothetical protein [Synergistaceae bacterium]
MDYEDFYGEYAAIANSLSEQLSTQNKLLKRICRNVERGDLKPTAKDLASAASGAKECVRLASEMAEKIASVDMGTYLESGDFARQLLVLCGETGGNIKGEGASYEIFPYRLKIDSQNEEVLVNGRKAIGLRPRAVAAELAKGRARLLAAAFNPSQYASELASAYDLALLAASKGKPVAPDSDIYLTTLYKFLTPMRRFRREYDAQAYAFDLARLYAAESNESSDGRRFQFGPSRNNNKAIRIVDESGNEQFLATIRFYRE